ncbi:MAG: hypothetical protein KF708_19505 [Pirellulales bacterium]|nr:hypothetical protein [Pirellulales bacterium]
MPDVEEVKIHAPEEFAEGGKDAKGRLVTKPISRQETKFNPVMIAAMVGGGLAVLLIAWVAGALLRSNVAVTGVALLLVTLPIVAGSYALLRDEELEPHRGRTMWIRSSLVSVVYVALWGVFAFLPASLFAENWNWLFIAPPFVLAGGTAAFAALELDFLTGVLHYMGYLLATVILRAIAGFPALWNLAEAAAATS